MKHTSPRETVDESGPLRSKPRVVRVRMNMGDLPYFVPGSGGVSAHDVERREIGFHHDRWVERFPLLCCASRIVDALEMNLFMMYRYRGRFRPSNGGGRRDPSGYLTIKTLVSIANSLGGFLEWLARHDVDWREVYAVPDSERAKAWLPPYRYRIYLIGLIEAGKLSRDTANLYINHVRQFYEWAFSTGRIDRVPFRYTRAPVRKQVSQRWRY